MRKILSIIFIISFAIATYSCDQKALPKEVSKNQQDVQNLANLVWRDSVLDLGAVKSGVEYPVKFYVKNTSQNALIFQKMESTCGCTVIDKKIEKPILPNQEDSIVAHFKMYDANGYIERKIYILANTKQQFYVLRVKANIIP